MSAPAGSRDIKKFAVTLDSNLEIGLQDIFL